jgi:phage shock protein B
MGVFEFIITLVCIVGGCITCWVYMVTSKKSRRTVQVDTGMRYSLSELSAMADSLQDRINTLESILDAEVPDWREQNEQSGKSAN